MSVFQALYDSEINWEITTFFDGGFSVALGDKMNGFDDSTVVDDLNAAEAWLEQAAIEHYPDSEFAKARNA